MNFTSLKKGAKFLALVILSLGAGRAGAQNWQPLGATDSWPTWEDPTMPKVSTSMNLGTDNNNVPYIVYDNLVKKYNGTKWVTVGLQGISTAYPQYPDIVFDGNNMPYIIFGDYNASLSNSSVKVKKFNGIDWVDAGVQTDLPQTETRHLHIAMDKATNTPYIIYTNQSDNKVSVRKLSGNNWVGLTTTDSVGQGSESEIALDNNNVPYVTFYDQTNSYKLTVKKFNGTAWSTVGAQGISAGMALSGDIAIDKNNVVYVTYLDAANGKIVVVKKFDGTNWVSVGTNVTSGSCLLANIAIGPNNVPYVIYKDEYTPPFSGFLNVSMYDAANNNWTKVGAPTTIATGVNFFANIVFAANGDAYATSYVEWMPWGGFVTKLVNGKWEPLGSMDGDSKGPIVDFDLQLDKNGTPYVTYSQENTFATWLIKYNGVGWDTIGGKIANKGLMPHVQFGLDGKPYVAFLDNDNSTKPAVKKFDGTNWVNVGPATFTTDGSGVLDFTISKAGVPYIAATDWGITTSTYFGVVKKFDGTNWVDVGGGAGQYQIGTQVRAVDIITDQNENVYIAYADFLKDYDGNGRVTVQKFNGTQWSLVGNAQISLGEAQQPKLQISSNGTLYLSYGGASDKGVKMFDGTNWIDVGAHPGNPHELVMTKSDTLYTVEKDSRITYGDQGRFVVRKFNGAFWEKISGADFSSQNAKYPIMKADSCGNLFLSYMVSGVFTQKMTAATSYAPNVTVSVTPGTSIPVGQPATFTANHAATGGITYQWYKNGAAINGATGSAYTDNGLADNDSVNVVMYTNNCGIMDTAVGNGSIIDVTVGIATVSNNADNIRIYPVPNAGTFTVKGTITTNAKAVNITVCNLVGQEIHTDVVPMTATGFEKEIKLGNIAAGVYIVKIDNGFDPIVRKITIR